MSPEQAEILARTEKLAAAWQARIAATWRWENLTPPVVEIETGKRYVRVIRAEGGGSRSAAGFVDLTDGAIYYPAGWKGPQKNHARGNVNAEDFGLSAFGDYAVKTLR